MILFVFIDLTFPLWLIKYLSESIPDINEILFHAVNLFMRNYTLLIFFGGSCGTRTRKSFGYEPNALTNCAKDPCYGAFHAAVRLSGLSEN